MSFPRPVGRFVFGGCPVCRIRPVLCLYLSRIPNDARLFEIKKPRHCAILSRSLSYQTPTARTFLRNIFSVHAFFVEKPHHCAILIKKETCAREPPSPPSVPNIVHGHLQKAQRNRAAVPFFGNKVRTPHPFCIPRGILVSLPCRRGTYIVFTLSRPAKNTSVSANSKTRV